jgi:hypothetical protein
VVASYASYRDAEKAVDYLAENKFPIEHVLIVGRDMQFVEQVTGKMSPTDAAVRGAAVGGLTGLLIGWLFALFSWFDPTIAWGWLVFDGLWFGMLVGGAIGLISYFVMSPERRFESISGMRPMYFDIAVDEQYAADAARMLGGFPLPSRVSPSPQPQPTPAAPPRAATPAT